MTDDSTRHDRRAFLRTSGQLGLLAAVPALPLHAASFPPAETASAAVVSSATTSSHDTSDDPTSPTLAFDYDLSWIARLSGASDRAVVDSPSLNDGFCLQIATRFMDNCDAAYGAGKHKAHVVLNVRTQAVPIGFRDEIWERFDLGVEYKVNDPVTKMPARRNPYLTLAPDQNPALGAVSALVARGATVLVCDFATGHLAKRLADKRSLPVDEVHSALRAGVVSGGYMVPSGIFGMARAQNAGCAFVGG
jgi:hypothetical protein